MRRRPLPKHSKNKLDSWNLPAHAPCAHSETDRNMDALPVRPGTLKSNVSCACNANRHGNEYACGDIRGPKKEWLRLGPVSYRSKCLLMRAAALQSISNKICKLWPQIPFTLAVTFEDALIHPGAGTCHGKLNYQPNGRSYLTHAFTKSPPCGLELGMDRNCKTSHGRDKSFYQKWWSNLVSRSTNILLFVKSQ